MKFYSQSIALFGIALPVLACALLAGLGFTLKSKAMESYENKSTLYQAYNTSVTRATDTEKKIAQRRGHFDRWRELLAEDPSSSVNINLRAIAETLPNKEFQKTAFERSTTKSGFGGSTTQPSSQLRIVFRGTFRTMQRAFLELESRMPQLQLQELRIEPNTNSQNPSALLNFQVNYTAWEN